MVAPPTPQARVAEARAALAATLDAIDDRLDVPKRARAAADRIRASYRSNPAPWIAGLVGVGVAAAGLIAFAVVRSRR